MKRRSIIQLLFAALCLVSSCVPAQDNADVDPDLDCATILQRAAKPIDPKAIEVSVTASAYRETCWRLAGPLLASYQPLDFPIRAVPIEFESTEASYYAAIDQKFQAGTVPDLVQLSLEQIVTYASTGDLWPLDNCIQTHSAFADLFPNLLQPLTVQGHIWGIPSELGVSMLFFNKLKLHELGWTEAEIESLPARIIQGQFTLFNLLESATQAVNTQIVENGFGFWPVIYNYDPWKIVLAYSGFGGQAFDANQQHLLLNRQALIQAYSFYRQIVLDRVTRSELIVPSTTLFFNTWAATDAINHSRVLFWLGDDFDWANLMTEYRDDVEPTLSPQEIVGYAPFPSATIGKPAPLYWYFRAIYAIPSAKATGRHQQAAACELLARTLTPEINFLDAARSGDFSVLRGQSALPEFRNQPFQQIQFTLWHQPTSQLFPGYLQSTNATRAYPKFVTALNAPLPQVQSGALVPAEAVEQVMIQLRREVGELVIIE